MRNKLNIVLFSILFAASVMHAAVTITKIEVIDSAGAGRSRFSSSERIGLSIKTNNSSEVSRIDYRFIIYGPTGSQVFSHSGNSSPGNIGLGGAALKNLPLNFYSGPGNYTFKGEVLVNNAVVAESRAYFNIYSPTLNLLYPPQGVRDLIDKPLIFRWISSGATKYEVRVSEDPGIYKTIWTGETTGNSISYPVVTFDERQKIIGGQTYYWRVTGKDSKGLGIAVSEVFDFSMKKDAISDFRRNVSIDGIIFNESSQFPDKIIITVEVSNNGSQAENDIGVALYVNGKLIKQEKIVLIPMGAVVKVDFNIGEFLEDHGTFGAFLDISDEDTRDNIMSKTLFIPLPEEYKGVPKIIGRVIDFDTRDGIKGARVNYKGPETGFVITKNNGKFKIEELLYGEYIIKVEYEDYEESDAIMVNINKKKAFPIKDIEIKQSVGEEEEIVEKEVKYTLIEALKIIKKYLSPDIISEFDGYVLKIIDIEPKASLNEVVSRLESGKAKVKKVEVKIK